MIELGGVMGLFRRSEPFTEPLAKTIVREVLKKKNTPTYEDETVDQFIERRLGKEVKLSVYLSVHVCSSVSPFVRR